MPRKIVALALGALLATTSCQQVISMAGQQAGNAAGDAAGNAAGNAISSEINAAMDGYVSDLVFKFLGPELMRFYVELAFSATFNMGGFWLEDADLAEGQWVKWKFENPDRPDEKSSVFEKAFVKRLNNGFEWWKIKFEDSGSDSKGPVIMEGLFDRGRENLLLVRGKFPHSEKPMYVPVRVGALYKLPTLLGQVYLEKHSKGSNVVTVAAGTFNTERIHLIFKGYVEVAADGKKRIRQVVPVGIAELPAQKAGPDGATWTLEDIGYIDWYRSNDAPGTIVKVEVSEAQQGSIAANRSQGQDQGPSKSLMTLQSFGNDAVAELGPTELPAAGQVAGDWKVDATIKLAGCHDTSLNGLCSANQNSKCISLAAEQVALKDIFLASNNGFNGITFGDFAQFTVSNDSAGPGFCEAASTFTGTRSDTGTFEGTVTGACSSPSVNDDGARAATAGCFWTGDFTARIAGR